MKEASKSATMFLTTVIGISLISLAFAAQSGNVAFTAILSGDRTTDAGSTVVFDQLLTTIGEGFNTATGVFTAPKAGDYVFHVNALTQVNNRIYVDLYRNDNYLVSIYAWSGAFTYDTASNVITQRLSKGDRVYLKARKPAYFYGQVGEVYTTFSGYITGLLFAPSV
uniref:C1q domain-containing protein n=1 Tax=Arion vulgaris TaxID=1028688 RepID=A0A0B7A1M5_9EUPU